MTTQEDIARLGIGKVPETTRRREHLAKYDIRCPVCQTQQVQLIQYFVAPARWKCRVCRHTWDQEPELRDLRTLPLNIEATHTPANRQTFEDIQAWGVYDPDPQGERPAAQNPPESQAG